MAKEYTFSFSNSRTLTSVNKVLRWKNRDTIIASNGLGTEYVFAIAGHALPRESSRTQS